MSFGGGAVTRLGVAANQFRGRVEDDCQQFLQLGLDLNEADGLRTGELEGIVNPLIGVG